MGVYSLKANDELTAAINRGMAYQAKGVFNFNKDQELYCSVIIPAGWEVHYYASLFGSGDVLISLYRNCPYNMKEDSNSYSSYNLNMTSERKSVCKLGFNVHPVGQREAWYSARRTLDELGFMKKIILKGGTNYVFLTKSFTRNNNIDFGVNYFEKRISSY